MDPDARPPTSDAPSDARSPSDAPSEPWWGGGEASIAVLDAVDLKIGGRVAVVAYAAAAVLIPVVALPIRSGVTEAVVLVIAGVWLVCAAGFAVLYRARRVTQRQLYVADFLWIGLTAALVAATGGRTSPFFLLYPLPVLHAGAFQSRRRIIIVSVTSVAAFLAPLVYGSGGTGHFVSTSFIAVPPALAVAWGYNVAVTTLRRQRRELAGAAHSAERKALTDPLTGLGNARQLWGTLASETSRARRHGNRFSLIVLDLDGFKAINDEAGHLVGDAALKDVAASLRTRLRTEDVCCRHGGDEFAVVAIGADEHEAAELAGRLAGAVSEVHVRFDGEHPLSATAGWATFSDPGATTEDLMRAADARLLERKYGRPRPDLPDATHAVAGDPLALLGALSRSLGSARDARAAAESAVTHLAHSLQAATIAAVEIDDHPARVVAAAPAQRRAGDGGERWMLYLAAEAVTQRRTIVQPRGSRRAAAGRCRRAVPLFAGERVWGALIVEPAPEHPFGDAERRLVDEVATETARALAQLVIVARLQAAGAERVDEIVSEFQHSSAERERVAALAQRVGQALALSDPERETLLIAASLRDLGAAGVPSRVLQKPDRLVAAERALLAARPIVAERLLRRAHLHDPADVVRHASEHWDGSGYPDGLEGQAIPLAARILHVSSAWVALTSPRPWRPPFNRSAATMELRHMAGAELDPEVVETLLAEGAD